MAGQPALPPVVATLVPPSTAKLPSPERPASRAAPQRLRRARRSAVLKAPKAATAADCTRLEDLPNIGPAMAADLRALGIAHPQALAGQDALALYQALCRLSGKRQDPCVLDTYMAATDFMRGAAPAPWWVYTAERKRLYATL